MNRYALALSVALLSSGCSPMDISDFSESPVAFVPEEYFAGHVVGQGTFFSRFGKNKAFTLDLHGRVEDGVLLIDETATYETGDVNTTSYRFERLSETQYRISSPSFVAPTIGELRGNALHWSYHYKHKSADGETIIKFDDWMILHEDGVLIDRAFGSKWGISVGEIVLSMRKVE